ncbi:DNA polymerase eta [Halotydeus destructor]|nr:DNA polymerase eta [Halotydeus destructor]
MERIIALIDMDCFYVQVEQRAEPDTWGKPCGVHQYQGGGLIAVNYEAREYGVTRGMRIDEAKIKCPEIHFFQVPEQRGKANLTKYRDASAEVFAVICDISKKIVVERASIDEAFLDLTDYVRSVEGEQISVNTIDDVGFEGVEKKEGQSEAEAFREKVNIEHTGNSFSDNMNLLIAAKVVREIRMAIKSATQFTCSAGVSHNKVLSKLACAIRKPNGQTVLPKCGVKCVYDRTAIKKVRNLGGKLGHRLRDAFMIETMGQLSECTMEMLTQETDSKTAEWLYALSRGIDDEAVSDRQLIKSVGCGKNFPKGLTTLDEAKHWSRQLAEEMVERLQKDESENKRRAKNVVVGVKFKNDQSLSRTLPIHEYDVLRVHSDIIKNALSRLQRSDDSSKIEPIINMSLSASKFVDLDSIQNSALFKTKKLDSFFAPTDNPNSVINSNKSTVAESEAKNEVLPDIEILPSTSCQKSEKRGFFFRKTQELIVKRARHT